MTPQKVQRLLGLPQTPQTYRTQVRVCVWWGKGWGRTIFSVLEVEATLSVPEGLFSGPIVTKAKLRASSQKGLFSRLKL